MALEEKHEKDVPGFPKTSFSFRLSHFIPISFPSSDNDKQISEQRSEQNNTYYGCNQSSRHV
ncbi:hypothetical protein D1872_155670 [compost metagenome]